MSYHRESWMMEKDEKLQTVPLLHMQGNTLVKQRQFREAASKYKEAVLLLKTVQSRVSPKIGGKDKVGSEDRTSCDVLTAESKRSCSRYLQLRHLKMNLADFVLFRIVSVQITSKVVSQSH